MKHCWSDIKKNSVWCPYCIAETFSVWQYVVLYQNAISDNRKCTGPGSYDRTLRMLHIHVWSPHTIKDISWHFVLPIWMPYPMILATNDLNTSWTAACNTIARDQQHYLQHLDCSDKQWYLHSGYVLRLRTKYIFRTLTLITP